MKLGYLVLFSFLLLIGCENNNPNLNTDGDDILEAGQRYLTNPPSLSYQDTVYVPIYSDIYSRSKKHKFNLTATLSIRNTSLTDSIFIEKIDYYDSSGKLVHAYLQRTLAMHPMETIEYVIEEDDTSGGTGANFIVCWGAQSDSPKPIFQGVMISTQGQQGISFVTNGISINQ